MDVCSRKIKFLQTIENVDVVSAANAALSIRPKGREAVLKNPLKCPVRTWVISTTDHFAFSSFW